MCANGLVMVRVGARHRTGKSAKDCFDPASRDALRKASHSQHGKS